MRLPIQLNSFFCLLISEILQQVMKFAEMTQEVQVARPTPMKADIGYTPGRRKANQIFKMAVHNLEERGRPEARKLDVDIGLVYSLGPKFPEYRLISPETDEIIIQLMQHLDQRIRKRATLLDDFNARGKRPKIFRANILGCSLFSVGF